MELLVLLEQVLYQTQAEHQVLMVQMVMLV